MRAQLASQLKLNNLGNNVPLPSLVFIRATVDPSALDQVPNSISVTSVDFRVTA